MSKNEISKGLDDLVKSFMKNDNIKIIDTKKETITTELVKTGLPTLDYVTNGGIPKGKLIRLSGEEGSGKSTLAKQLSVLLGRNILYIDTEYAYDQKNTDLIINPDDVDNFFVASSSSTENVCDMINKSIPHFDVIIWDSLQNTASEEELGKTAHDRSRANRAIVLSQELPKIMYLLDKYNKSLILVSQVSQNQNKINKYDKDYVVSGGKRLDHNVYLDLWLYKSTKDKSTSNTRFGSKVVEGIDSRIVCEKLRNNPSYRAGRLTMPYNEYGGFTREQDIVRCAEELNLLEGRYSYKDIKLGRSKDDVKQFLKDNAEVSDLLYNDIYNHFVSNEEKYKAHIPPADII